ncbi:uncharacterized protein G6M90_00g051950 [Metarhizium brunneum]|uniref:Uncharacterized protein n=1 Tax=Metarhizium brunneum TaxID=500148 RepID=A0A7D5UWR3_9HYPO|nr:hypothetical protein G6M90_00g051950 [Metarhizium brunneum]
MSKRRVLSQFPTAPDTYFTVYAVMGIPEGEMGEIIMFLARQNGLDLIDEDAAAVIYEVNMVLKACKTYQRPARGASRRNWWDDSDSTLFSHRLSRQEKAFFECWRSYPTRTLARSSI